jgi:hypothetical protein
MDALGEEEVTSARVVKLFPVIALDSLDACDKLGGGVGDEVSKRAESVRFKSQRKRPQVVSAIIKYNQIIFITRNTDHWRGPQVTMNKIKLARHMRGGRMKG